MFLQLQQQELEERCSKLENEKAALVKKLEERENQIELLQRELQELKSTLNNNLEK